MQPSEVPEDVRLFLRDHIESYEQLELLLLLRNERDVSWTAETLSTRVRMPSSLVSAALSELHAAGFVAVSSEGGEERHRYLLLPGELEATICKLAQVYREQPIEIVKLMSANAIERVRTAALRTFADAFILRKDKTRG